MASNFRFVPTVKTSVLSPECSGSRTGVSGYGMHLCQVLSIFHQKLIFLPCCDNSLALIPHIFHFLLCNTTLLLNEEVPEHWRLSTRPLDVVFLKVLTHQLLQEPGLVTFHVSSKMWNMDASRLRKKGGVGAGEHKKNYRNSEMQIRLWDVNWKYKIKIILSHRSVMRLKNNWLHLKTKGQEERRGVRTQLSGSSSFVLYETYNNL